MSLKAVIFDLDNTLNNRRIAFRQYTNCFIDKYIIVKNNRKEIIEYIEKADRDGYRSKIEIYNELLSDLKWKKKACLEELLEYWNNQFPKCTTLMGDAIEVIETIKNKDLKLGIITNGSVTMQNAKIDQSGLRKYFDIIIISDELGFKKPDSRIFNVALDKLNLKAKNAIYIGDNPYCDIKGARDAGLKTVWMEGFRKWDLDGIKADYKIDNLKELLSII